MNRLKFLLIRSADVLSALAVATAAVSLAAIVVIVSWQVFSRYALQQTPSWSEETAQLLTLLLSFTGAAFAYRQRMHISVELLRDRLPDIVQRVRRGVIDLTVALFGGFMLVRGVSLAVRTWSQQLPGTELPAGVSYLPIPVCGAMLIVFAVEKLALGEADAGGGPATVDEAAAESADG